MTSSQVSGYNSPNSVFLGRKVSFSSTVICFLTLSKIPSIFCSASSRAAEISSPVLLRNSFLRLVTCGVAASSSFCKPSMLFLQVITLGVRSALALRRLPRSHSALTVWSLATMPLREELVSAIDLLWRLLMLYYFFFLLSSAFNA